MGLSLKPEHLKRYKDVVWLLIKYGRSDLVRKAGIEVVPDEPGSPAVTPKAAELASDLEKLGPTFIKLGQLLSTRPDLLPPPYIEALSRLQDKVEPFSFEEVESIVSSELGVRISRAFSEFDPTPLAAASLGQVHRAALRDGRQVAVKVQRPHIRERIAEDLAALDEIAELLDKHTEAGKRYEFRRILEEFRKTLLRELDYRQEARNLAILDENLKGFAGKIVVPSAIDDYTSSRVLTMDYVRGKKVTSISPLAKLEMDGSVLAEDLFRAYLHQILVDGFFHADPHPGNVFLTDDGQLALLDLGMTARIGPDMQDKLLQLLLAISDGRAEEAARIAVDMGEPKETFDREQFLRRVGSIVSMHQDARIEEIDVGRVLLEVVRLSGESGLRPPHELTLLAKTLLNLDQVGRALDPKFDPNAFVRRHAAEILRQRTLKNLSPGNVLTALLELKDFLGKLPSRAGKILDSLANNQLEIKVDTINEKQLIEGLQKIANRIALGLVLAATIIAGSMLMSVESRFTLLGYPGFAILLFLFSLGGGLALVLSILLHDRKRKP